MHLVRSAAVGAFFILQSGTAHAQFLDRLTKSLEQVNGALEETNRALAGQPATVTLVNSPPSAGVARITDGQRSAISQRLASPQTNAELQEAIRQATSTIQPLLERVSCISNYNQSILTKFAAPGYAFGIGHVLPMIRMQYHDKATCLDVVRLQGWSMPARNALKFEVVFEAPDSGESMKNDYTLVRQPDGVWLVHRAS